MRRMEYDEDQLDQAISMLTPLCEDAEIPYAIRNEVCVALGRVRNARQFRFEFDDDKRRRWCAVSGMALPLRPKTAHH
jgi:hypothetical protein